MPKILKQNKPAKHRKAVVFCADRNVVRFAQFIARQIMLAEPERDYDICITTFDSLMVDLDKVDPEIRICQIDEKPFESLRTDSRITSTAYILLGLPEIFAQEYEQIAYLDTDVFLKTGKMSELFAAANPDFAISGVMDSTQWYSTPNQRQTNYWQALGLIGKQYLNTGVLVLNVQKCLAEGFYTGSMQAAMRLAQIKKDNPMILFLHDQSAINMHLLGNWAPISLRWNWQTTQESSRLVKYFDPYIMHFASKTKPWVDKPVGHTKAFLPEYKQYFADVLHEELIGKTYQSQKVDEGLSWWQKIRLEMAPAKISMRLNVINPFYYTGLRGLIPIYLQYKNIIKAEKAIKAGHPIWPRKAIIKNK